MKTSGCRKRRASEEPDPKMNGEINIRLIDDCFVKLFYFIPTMMLCTTLAKVCKHWLYIIEHYAGDLFASCTFSPLVDCMAKEVTLPFATPSHMDSLRLFPAPGYCFCPTCLKLKFYKPIDFKELLLNTLFQPSYIRCLILGPRCYITQSQLGNILEVCSQNLTELHVVASTGPHPLPPLHYNMAGEFDRLDSDHVPWGYHVGTSVQAIHKGCCTSNPQNCPYLTKAGDRGTLKLQYLTINEWTFPCIALLLHDKWNSPELHTIHVHGNNTRSYPLGFRFFEWSVYAPALRKLCLSNVFDMEDVYNESLFYRNMVPYPHPGIKSTNALKWLHLCTNLKILNLPDMYLSPQRFENLDPTIDHSGIKAEKWYLAKHPRLLKNIQLFGNEDLRITHEQRCGSRTRGEMLTYKT